MLRRAWALDTPALDPNSSHPPLRANLRLTLQNRRFGAAASASVAARAAAFLRQLLKRGLLPGREPVRLPTGCILVVAGTRNQWLAVEPVARALGERSERPVVLLDPDATASLLNRDLAGPAYRMSLLFLPALVRRWRGADAETRGSFRWAADGYLHSYGLYVALSRWLAAAPPAAVLVSNDHSRPPCVLRSAAQGLGVPVAYLQHATVTERFPPLRFDLALLDGLDAAEKYAAAADREAAVALVGIPKADPRVGGTRPDAGADRVGLCMSLADDPDRSAELVEGLASHGLDLVLRMHPRSEPGCVDRFRRLARRLGLGWSDPAEEDSFAFLGGLRVLVAGVSAMSLEAALVGVTPLNFQTNPEETDWYGFVRNGLCRQTDRVEVLAGWIDEALRSPGRPPTAARRYCHTLGTSWEGESAALAAQAVAGLAEGRPPSAPLWREVPLTGPLRVFERSEEPVDRPVAERPAARDLLLTPAPYPGPA